MRKSTTHTAPTYRPTYWDSMRHGGHEFIDGDGNLIVVTRDAGDEYLIGAYEFDAWSPNLNPPAAHLPWEFDRDNTVIFADGVAEMTAHLIAIGVAPIDVPTEDRF